jgi:hypothetical protein
MKKKRRKIILVLIDGVGDVQLKYDKVPSGTLFQSSLEKSVTPVLDSISRTFYILLLCYSHLLIIIDHIHAYVQEVG